MALLFQGTIIRISQDDIVTTPVSVYEDFACITGYSLDGAGRAEIDTTCSTSTSKEFVFGLRDQGTLSLDINYDPETASNGYVDASYASDKPYSFQIEYANSAGTSGSVKTFDGYVINRSDSGAIDDKITGAIEIKLSGDVNTVSPTP